MICDTYSNRTTKNKNTRTESNPNLYIKSSKRTYHCNIWIWRIQYQSRHAYTMIHTTFSPESKTSSPFARNVVPHPKLAARSSDLWFGRAPALLRVIGSRPVVQGERSHENKKASWSFFAAEKIASRRVMLRQLIHLQASNSSFLDNAGLYTNPTDSSSSDNKLHKLMQ